MTIEQAIREDIKLSKNFALSELLRSQTASRKGIDNRPDETQLENMKKLCQNLLQPIRDNVGSSVNVNSGLRVPELNTAIGGSATSQHCKGEASDIEAPALSTLELAQLIIRMQEEGEIEFDQLILEYYDPEKGPNSGWVHISYSEGNNRNRVMYITKDSGGYRLGLGV